MRLILKGNSKNNVVDKWHTEYYHKKVNDYLILHTVHVLVQQNLK